MSLRSWAEKPMDRTSFFFVALSFEPVLTDLTTRIHAHRILIDWDPRHWDLENTLPSALAPFVVLLWLLTIYRRVRDMGGHQTLAGGLWIACTVAWIGVFWHAIYSNNRMEAWMSVIVVSVPLLAVKSLPSLTAEERT